MGEGNEKNRTSQEVSSSIIRGLDQALAHSIGDKSDTISENKHFISPLPNHSDTLIQKTQ